MNTIDAIIKAKFLATEAQVQNLAGIVSQGQTATSIYLGIVVAHTQAELEGKRRVTPRVQEAAVDIVHKRFYPCALAGVGPPDMPQDERNRRAIFARTAVSDLRFYIKHGGDVRTLEPLEVKKSRLRSAVADNVPEGTTRAERTVSKALGTFERTVLRIAKADPAVARRQIEDAQAKLEAMLEALNDVREHGKRPRKPAVRVTSTKGLRRTRHAPDQPTAH